SLYCGVRMVQHKRKPKPKVRKVRAAKKKAKKVLRTLKRVSAAKSRAVKKRLRARLPARSEEHTSELQSRVELVCRLLLEKNYEKCPNMNPPVVLGDVEAPCELLALFRPWSRTLIGGRTVPPHLMADCTNDLKAQHGVRHA